MLMRDRFQRTWWRLVDWGFCLLYNDLAWLYDPVSWLASLGHWRAWGRAVLAYLPAQGQILEVGSGPGHLLAALSQAGLEPLGLDLSPAMLRLAGRRLRKSRLRVPLCRAEATALPFAPATFEAVVAAFPTAYVYDDRWRAQAWRVLKPEGCLIVVEAATFESPGTRARAVNWLYHVTGRRGPHPSLVALLDQAGFVAQHHLVHVDNTAVSLVVARR
jgi:ubiquinone/menaquinone biosynthesis C-methylase UbiE